MKTNYVYYSSNLFGKLINNEVKKLDNEELNLFLSSLEKEIIKADTNRKIFSKILGIICLIITIALGILSLVKVINIGLFNYTLVIALAILVWEVLYYLCGLLFYKKINIDVHFKSLKSINPNTLIAYNSTDYSKYMDKYVDNKNNLTFTHPNTNKLVTLGLFNKVKLADRFNFNGKIISNIAYYYLAYQSTRIIFLPGIVIYINKDKSKVVLNKDFRYTYNDKIVTLFINDEKIFELKSEELFNVNIFNFKY